MSSARSAATPTPPTTTRRRGSTITGNILKKGDEASEVLRNAAKFRLANGTLSLFSGGGKGLRRKGVIAKTYQATQKADERRKRVLLDGRTLSPINTIFRIDKMNQTVLYAIIRSPTTWVVFGVYAASFSLTYFNVWPEVVSDFVDGGRDTFSGADLLVTFMIVFYVGYCYSRYMEMFNDLELVMRNILNCCAVARTSFKNTAALYDLWRHLNLLHVTAYCGVTQTYTRENLFDDFCEAHALLIDHNLRARFIDMDIDNKGSLACNTCMVWSLQTIHARAEAGDFSPPIHKEMVSLVTGIGSGLDRLYAREYQVLPYIYTHLVSLACFGYLAATAFLKGLEAPLYRPPLNPNITEVVAIDYSGYKNAERTFTFGFAMPFISICLMLVTIFGLLHIGSKLANPLGAAKEAFAVCHFVNYTASTSLEIVAAQTAPQLLKAQQMQQMRMSSAASASASSAKERKASGSTSSDALKALEATFASQSQALQDAKPSQDEQSQLQKREAAIAARLSRMIPPAAKGLVRQSKVFGRKNSCEGRRSRSGSSGSRNNKHGGWESTCAEESSTRHSEDGGGGDDSPSPRREGGRRSPFFSSRHESRRSSADSQAGASTPPLPPAALSPANSARSEGGGGGNANGGGSAAEERELSERPRRSASVNFEDEVGGSGNDGGDESPSSPHASPDLPATVGSDGVLADEDEAGASLLTEPEEGGRVVEMTAAEQEEMEQLKMINAMQAYQLKRRSLVVGATSSNRPAPMRRAGSSGGNLVRPKSTSHSSVRVEMGGNI